MVGRCVPCTSEQFHTAELFYRDTAPVGRRTGRLQPTAALSCVLIAQRTKLTFAIPAQPVWAEPSLTAVIGSPNRPLAHDGAAKPLINVLDRLDLRSDNTHGFNDTQLSRPSSMMLIYNTVILFLRPGRR